MITLGGWWGRRRAAANASSSTPSSTSAVETLETLGVVEGSVDTRCMGGEAADDSVDQTPSADVDASDQVSEALATFKDAALTWAGTGYGKPLVDAAVDALAAGLDSPTLRILAGAPARFSDEEATEYGPDTFDELGLAVPEKHSPEAYLELAKLKARRFLAGEGSARSVSIELWQLYQQSDYCAELADFSGLDDWYVMLDDGVIEGETSAVDAAVRESAQRLLDGLPSTGPRLGGAFVGHEPPPPSRESVSRRVLRRIRIVP